MPWVKSYRKIRAAAFFVRRVHRRVRTLLKMRTDVCHQVSACRESEDSNFVRIDMPLLGVKANQSYRSLRVFKRHRRFRIDLVLDLWVDLWVAMRPRTWHPVLEQYAGYPLGGQPIADLSTFKINGQIDVTPAWKDDDRNTRVLSVGRIHSHRWLRDIFHHHHRLTGNQILRILRIFRVVLGTFGRLGIRRRPRPYPHLCMSRRRLPRIRLRVQIGKRKHNTKSEEQRNSDAHE